MYVLHKHNNTRTIFVQSQPVFSEGNVADTSISGAAQSMDQTVPTADVHKEPSPAITSDYYSDRSQEESSHTAQDNPWIVQDNPWIVQDSVSMVPLTTTELSQPSVPAVVPSNQRQTTIQPQKEQEVQCTCTCTCVYACIHVSANACTFMYMYVCTHAIFCLYMSVYVHTYTCTCMYIVQSCTCITCVHVCVDISISMYNMYVYLHTTAKGEEEEEEAASSPWPGGGAWPREEGGE